MATEEEKLRNRLRMFGIQVGGMCKGLYDLFGDAAFATMQGIGKEMLVMMEEEMAFELEGETPEHVIMELGRLLQDEIGVIQDFDCEQDGNQLTLSVKNCMGWYIAKKILDSGVDTPYYCWPMNLGTAALNRMGKKVRRKIHASPEGCKVVFTLIES